MTTNEDQKLMAQELCETMDLHNYIISHMIITYICRSMVRPRIKVDVLGFPSLTVLMVSVDVKPEKAFLQSLGAV